MKQVIVFRSDLKLGKGKLAAQAGHAAVTGYELILKKHRSVAEAWLGEGQKKVVLKVKDLNELTELFEKVKKKLPALLITDAGLTQIPAGTVTCLVIGPWHDEEIGEFTRVLKLL